VTLSYFEFRAAVAVVLSRPFRLLRGATGVHFGFYKPSIVKRHLARRMAIAKAERVAFLCAETRTVTSPRIHSVVQGAKSPQAEFQGVLGGVGGESIFASS
jgi:hypothetical protein